ncbi:hypothetical protein BCR42DRAFT_423241 [Absidia repens]|uniref:Sds3-like-domain-containing protein n=1 Tax=Absidia repens TaxID=90262 RepID=A0A1X2I5N9_9FUNG|nr:hypothetical protein BCR42DRAFT_423241 [Absidia repens]
MPIANANTVALERPATRKTTSMISNKATNNKNNNASPRRPNQNPKDALKPTDMVLTRKRGTHTDTVAATTTTSSTATTADCNVTTPVPPLPSPSCPSTPTPVKNSELNARNKQTQRRKKTRSRRGSKRTPRATLSSHTTEKTTTTTADTGEETSAKVEHDAVDQTEDSITLSSSSQQTISAALSPTTTVSPIVDTENGVVPEAPAATIDDNSTTDILETKDNTQDSKEALEALSLIEVEFARLRQKVFDEKMEALYEEMVMIEKGIHPDQLEMMKEIEKKRHDCIEMATAKRDMGRLAHQNRFESTVYQADLAFTRKRKELRTDIHQILGKRRLKLNDEHLNTSEETPDDLSNVSSAQRQHRFNQTHKLQHVSRITGFPRAPLTEGISEQSAHCDLTHIQGKLVMEQSSTPSSHSGHSPLSPPMFSTTPTTPSSASSSSSSSVIMAPEMIPPHQLQYTSYKINSIPMVDIRQDPTTIR